MRKITRGRLRPLADTSTSTIVAGFIAMLTGYTSSLVLMFKAGRAGQPTADHHQSGLDVAGAPW